MEAKAFLQGLSRLQVDFYTGVPDSLLKSLGDTLFEKYGLSGRHVVAANEGGAIGLAAGHYIATGHPAMVYLQNSGLGNAVNPVVSLLSERVYGIPCVLVVGWRGEPGTKDEPQHMFQGEITPETLKLLGLTVFTIDAGTEDKAFTAMVDAAAPKLAAGQSVAFLVAKGGLTGNAAVTAAQPGILIREDALQALLSACDDNNYFVATTGKTSREVYELREKLQQKHDHDFLTVGSMGHAGMIALGIAKAKPDATVWCLDGDGAALMHMGALAVEVQQNCHNLIHVVLNNGAHESVGGMPVAGGTLQFAPVMQALGYAVTTCETQAEIAALPGVFRQSAVAPRFVEILLRQGSRADLGRPTISPRDNLTALMRSLNGEENA